MTAHDEWPDHAPQTLVLECDLSLSFVALIFTVSSAVLILSVAHLGRVPLVALLLFEGIIGCFYSGIAYAVIPGKLRHGDRLGAVQCLRWGNLLSEWFGIYPLVGALVPVIWALSREIENSAIIVLGAAVANLGGFAVFSFAGLGMASRFEGPRVGRWLQACVAIVLLLEGVAVCFDSNLAVNATVAVFALVTVLASIIDWHRGELRSGSVDPQPS